MSGPDPIAVISKNSIDEIRVSWQEFKGHRYLDIRTYTELTGKPEKVATKRGITLRPDLLPELRAALEEAEALVRKAGLVK